MKEILGYAIIEIAMLTFAIGFCSLIEGKITKQALIIGSSVIFGIEAVFGMIALAVYILK